MTTHDFIERSTLGISWHCLKELFFSKNDINSDLHFVPLSHEELVKKIL